MSKKYLLFSSFFTTLFYCFFLQVSIANYVVQFVPLEYCTENQNKKTDKSYDCCKFNCLTVEVEEPFFKHFDFTVNNFSGFKINFGLKKEEYLLIIEQKNNSPPIV